MSNTASAQTAEQTAPLPKNYIPYPLRSQITQIDPQLDVFWQEYLYNLFLTITPQDRKNIAEQILAPKQIFWSKEHKKFVFRGNANVPFEDVVSSIPEHAKHIRVFAGKILVHFQTFKTYTNITQIADFLENILNQIEQLDAKNNLEFQLVKRKLYTGFIYAAARVISEKKDLEIPKNCRGLNASIIKTFINEVFLKHYLLGYWFKTMRNREVADMPHPLINDFLRKQQKIRQLEIVRASKYLFAIGPTHETNVNPFALRRFLREENLFSNQHILLTGVAVNTALLANADETYLLRFRRQVENIITIESNIDPAVVECLTQLEMAHENQLLPLLFAPLEMSGANIDSVISQRLQDYEMVLMKQILSPIEYAVRHVARHTEEFEYLYIGVRQLFGSILSTFKDFLTLPALLLNPKAEYLFSRLVAYATFLEKRRDQIFISQSTHQWDMNHRIVRQPLQRLRYLIQNNANENDDLNSQLKESREQLYRKTSFIDRMLKSQDRIHLKMDELKKQMRRVGRQIHQDIFALTSEFPNDIVDLEFDSLLITNESERHYAFAAGSNGVTRLPMVIPVSENSGTFDLSEFSQLLRERMYECALDDEVEYLEI